ncbi:substrate-binding domain-containing protein [Nonomuraea wenchangensis]
MPGKYSNTVLPRTRSWPWPGRGDRRQLRAGHAAATVPLSSIRQPRRELGRVAAELLLEEIDIGERHRRRQVLFAPEVIVRASSVRG